MKHDIQNRIVFAFREDELSAREVQTFEISCFFTSIVLLVGIGGLGYDVFSFTADLYLPIGLGVGLIILLQICLSREAFRKIAWVIPLILLAVLFVLGNDYIADGFRIVLNRYFDILGRSFGEIYPVYPVHMVPEAQYLCETMFLCVLAVLLSCLCLYLSRNVNKIVSTVLFVVLLVALSFLDVSPGIQWLVLVFLAEVLLFIRNKLPGNDKLKGSNVIFGLVFLISVCVVLVAGYMVLDFESRYYGDRFSKLGDSLIKVVDHIRYDKSGHRLPDGDFSNLTDLIKDDQPHLEVTMSTPESLYLRGYVGSVYNGSGWEDLETSLLHGNAELFYWLHVNGFYGQMQIANVATLVEPALSEEINRISIINSRASSKYIYAPYEVYEADTSIHSTQKIGDIVFSSKGIFGNREYSFSSISNQVKRYNVLAALLYEERSSDREDIDSYLNNEGHYNEFVYDSYTDIPDNVRSLLEYHLGAYIIEEGQVHYSYAMAKQNILALLSDSKNVYYSETDIAASLDSDFLQFFLEETRTGYDVHFATAATLMFRYYGIPARYVEGYLVTPRDVTEAFSGEAIVINGDEHAHAWTEIYQDGIGWVPFEATPPYIGIMEYPEDLYGITDVDEIENGPPPEDEPDDVYENTEWNGLFSSEMVTAIVRFAPIAIAVVLVLILVRFLLGVAKRRRKLKMRLSLFNQESYAKSIESIFQYTVDLLVVLGLSPGKGSLYEHASAVGGLLDESPEMYINALRIHQEARFSGHMMTIEEKKYLLEFKQTVLNKLISTNSFPKRVSLRLMKGLY